MTMFLEYFNVVNISWHQKFIETMQYRVFEINQNLDLIFIALITLNH